MVLHRADRAEKISFDAIKARPLCRRTIASQMSLDMHSMVNDDLESPQSQSKDFPAREKPLRRSQRSENDLDSRAFAESLARLMRSRASSPSLSPSPGCREGKATGGLGGGAAALVIFLMLVKRRLRVRR